MLDDSNPSIARPMQANAKDHRLLNALTGVPWTFIRLKAVAAEHHADVFMAHLRNPQMQIAIAMDTVALIPNHSGERHRLWYGGSASCRLYVEDSFVFM